MRILVKKTLTNPNQNEEKKIKLLNDDLLLCLTLNGIWRNPRLGCDIVFNSLVASLINRKNRNSK